MEGCRFSGIDTSLALDHKAVDVKLLVIYFH